MVIEEADASGWIIDKVIVTAFLPFGKCSKLERIIAHSPFIVKGPRVFNFLSRIDLPMIIGAVPTTAAPADDPPTTAISSK